MIYAFNGNKYTDGISGHEYNNGINQIEIYAQNGIIHARYDISECQRTSSTNYNLQYTVAQTYRDDLPKSGYTNPITNNTQGVGSGAGYIETSNGTYTVYNEDSNGNFTTVYTGE